MSAGRQDGDPGVKQGPTCDRPGSHAGDAPAASPEPGGSMPPSSDWHARLGPLDFSVGIRHFELRGIFPEQPPSRPGTAAAGEPPRGDPLPDARIRATEDTAPERESEGGTPG